MMTCRCGVAGTVRSCPRAWGSGSAGSFGSSPRLTCCRAVSWSSNRACGTTCRRSQLPAASPARLSRKRQPRRWPLRTRRRRVNRMTVVRAPPPCRLAPSSAGPTARCAAGRRRWPWGGLWPRATLRSWPPWRRRRTGMGRRRRGCGLRRVVGSRPRWTTGCCPRRTGCSTGYRRQGTTRTAASRPTPTECTGRGLGPDPTRRCGHPATGGSRPPVGRVRRALSWIRIAGTASEGTDNVPGAAQGTEGEDDCSSFSEA
mmetsp:Transcript_23931/g.71508  ORF Transcript_23931/g.71508 Transcript_23931/m.71508 type:complete len:258 (-) Transcript_23931:84-857(-)